MPEFIRPSALCLFYTDPAVGDRGIKIKAKLDTIHEADNGLEEDEEGYQEYYAAIVKVLSVVETPTTSNTVKTGSLQEISMQDPPSAIWLEDGTIVWPKG